MKTKTRRIRPRRPRGLEAFQGRRRRHRHGRRIGSARGRRALLSRNLRRATTACSGPASCAESLVVDYPRFKLTINRLANLFIKLLFRIPLNDTTNAFKLYRRETIDGLRPLLSHHFNLTVELPLKAIVRGFTYSVIPIGWRNRTEGVSKLKLKEMGSRYLFIVLYVWLEQHLAKGDYRRNRATAQMPGPQTPN